MNTSAAPAPVLSYGRYLHLEQLLSAQHTQSGTPPAHDELLFIIVHQAHELWFKQILFELDSVLGICGSSPIPESSIGLATQRLERMATIFELLGQHLKVLETMTPMDFLEFRHHLTPASGFQSVQFRLIEAKLGLPKHHLESLKSGMFGDIVSASDLRQLEDTLAQPSLLDRVVHWLERTPFLQTEEFEFWSAYRQAIQHHLDTDTQMIRSHQTVAEDERTKRLAEVDRTRQAFMDLFDEQKHNALVADGIRRFSLRAQHAALFIYLYRDQPILQSPFRFLTQLTRIDELIQSWRASHVQMVHRMIGVKIGTGGSSGYDYLKSTVHSRTIFGDLCALSTFLLPRSSLPELPQSFTRKLGFWNER
jgi:tryptophan 2,3-dioxygenase